jgi:hypothetical protein
MQVFTNAALHAITTDSVIYQALSNEDVTVHNLLITNSDTANVSITLRLHKGSDYFYLLPNGFQLKPMHTLEMKPINLIANDQLVIHVDRINVCDVFASILKEVRDF